MQNESLTIIDNRAQKSYELQLRRGTIRASDLRRIETDQGDFGVMSYEPAFVNAASCQSTVTYVDGDFALRRYPIEYLAEHSTFLEVAYLLLQGELPTEFELRERSERVMRHAMIHGNFKKFMKGFHHDLHPMGLLISTVAALSAFYPEARNIKGYIENFMSML
jgi:citrate synthase